MEPQEIDSALDELENRLDRLRSLYEQYFMGIEKIEPTVPRKDIDRRFWILRRTQIRNTARRFRLQTLVQRYNTFQQHWTRICREIENGTYVRHLLKAQKNLGAEPKTWAAKKRLGLLRRTAEGAPASNPPPADGAAPAAPGASSLPPPPVPDRASSRPSIASRTPSAFPSVRPQNLPPLDLELEDAAALSPARRSVPPVAPAVSTPGAGKPPIPARATAATSVPATPIPRPQMPSRPDSPRAPMPSHADAPRPPMPSRPDAPRPPMPSRPDAPRAPSNIPLPATRAPVSPPLGAKSAAPAAAAKPVSSVANVSVPGVGSTVAAAKAPVASANRVPSPAAKAPAPPVLATAEAAAAPAAKTPTAATPARPAPPVAADAGASARAAAAKPVARPAPAAPAAKPASGLSDERVAQLHAELNAARRQLNQATSVSVDSLAKSLRETESKLKSQHGGRAVDFQVVIKDGKPIVKPVVRRQG